MIRFYYKILFPGGAFRRLYFRFARACCAFGSVSRQESGFSARRGLEYSLLFVLWPCKPLALKWGPITLLFRALLCFGSSPATTPRLHFLVHLVARCFFLLHLAPMPSCWNCFESFAKCAKEISALNETPPPVSFRRNGFFCRLRHKSSLASGPVCSTSPGTVTISTGTFQAGMYVCLSSTRGADTRSRWWHVLPFLPSLKTGAAFVTSSATEWPTFPCTAEARGEARVAALVGLAHSSEDCLFSSLSLLSLDQAGWRRANALVPCLP